ncbi:MAG: beta-Ala-His dipeptidase, partial [Bacteroidota bacterium]|nr:beta-Ala-His dipeptidase [Bacteroidota bacterium]
MSSEIKNLDPQSLWENFYSLTQTPRPSKKEEKIQEFLYNFGVQHGLETIKDEVGNIIIRKPATPGMEDRMGVIFQGHLDMVPQKNEGTDHNFETDPIPAYIEGEWVKAKGTTLGADNGIGVSAAMAVLASKDIAHGPVEALFTCDEETGMTGASNLKAGVLKGDILLNVDSEDEGELYVGCAGGVDATAYFEYSKELVPSDHHAFSVSITGLKGGHSGMDINLGRGNANKIFFRLLKELNYLYGARLASISGGSLRNAIPREAFGVITIDQSHVDDVHDFIAKF